QIRAVSAYFTVGAAKTGMLFSAPVIEAVVSAFQDLSRGEAGGSYARPPLVVDPVMVATSGARLLNEDAIEALTRDLLPLADLITPNMNEAALLARRRVESLDDLDSAAKAIYQRFGRPVLVKGGHLKEALEVVDCLFDGKETRFFRGPFQPGLNTHGTGCTLSAAIAVMLMQGRTLADAVSLARQYLEHTLLHAVPVGRERLLNHQFAPLRMAAP
ncbi:MAG: hydroxymethylpyrimidine/phosphomethylpyrimidine kinase, partial [Deltaproteobacteria bacterium]|nr:hydroxymethylpyrimidine/phosphomethylpyrimidine kinase [Deltaproteobacteria bacterium]